MKQTATNRILEVLAEGPSIAGEVAATLGMDRRLANAHLAMMIKRNRVTRSKYTRTDGAPGRKTVWLYAANGRLGVPA
jgi:predicted ArsR family transcriptional regulator